MMSMKYARWGITESIKARCIKVGRVEKTRFHDNQVVRRKSDVPTKNDKPEAPKNEKPEVPPEKGVWGEYFKFLGNIIEGGNPILVEEHRKFLGVRFKSIKDGVSRLNEATQAESSFMKQMGRFLQLCAACAFGSNSVQFFWEYFKPGLSFKDILDATKEINTLLNLKSDITDMKQSLKIIELQLKGDVKKSGNELESVMKNVEDCLVRVEAVSRNLSNLFPTSEDELKGDLLYIRESLIQVQTLMKNAAKQSANSENELTGDLKVIKDGMVRVERYLKISANRPCTYQPRAMDYSRRIGEAPKIR